MEIMQHDTQISSASIQSSGIENIVQSVIQHALEAANPETAIQAFVTRTGNRLIIGNQEYLLNSIDTIFIVSIGKAAIPMARAAQRLFGDKKYKGIAVTKSGYERNEPPIQGVSMVASSHPVPDQKSIQAAQLVFDLLAQTGPDDLVLYLISGGGSALVVDPYPDITLSDIQSLTALLLASGADIREINTVRKHIDRVKGGGLARAASMATRITLALSDVIGNDPDVIASGPTVPDPTTYQNAVEILEKYRILDRVTQPLLNHLMNGVKGILAETPKPNDPFFAQSQYLIVGSIDQSARKTIQFLESQGVHSMLLTARLVGEARQAGRFLAAIAQQVEASLEPVKKPACIIAGGETTVTVTGSGTGGRNLELALGAVEGLAHLPDVLLITLATDGGDGPTDVAGAAVSGTTFERAKTLSLNPASYLANNDSYRFFSELNDTIKTGPTGTNVNDLVFLFIGCRDRLENK